MLFLLSLLSLFLCYFSISIGRSLHFKLFLILRLFTELFYPLSYTSIKNVRNFIRTKFDLISLFFTLFYIIVLFIQLNVVD